MYETRDAGASWQPRGDGLPAEDAYLTVLREAFDQLGSGPSLELYFGATSGAVYGSGDAGASWSVAAEHLPPVLSVTALLDAPSLARAQRQLHRHGGPAARRRRDVQRAVQRVDAVAQPVQPGAVGVRAADAVVADAQPQAPVDRRASSTQALCGRARAWRCSSAPRP